MPDRSLAPFFAFLGRLEAFRVLDFIFFLFFFCLESATDLILLVIDTTIIRTPIILLLPLPSRHPTPIAPLVPISFLS